MRKPGPPLQIQRDTTNKSAIKAMPQLFYPTTNNVCQGKNLLSIKLHLLDNKIIYQTII